MRPGSEAQVALDVGALDIEAVRVGKQCRVAVGRAQHAVHRVTDRELDISINSSLENMSRGRLYGAVPSQRLLDDFRDQGWISPDSRKCFRMRKQRPE